MKKIIAVMTLLLLMASMAMAQAAAQTPAAAAQTTPTPAAPTGFRKEFLGSYDLLCKKIVDLATKMPEEKYDWRPGEGVRSIGEVYLHMGIANYSLSRFVGATIPADINLKGLEKSKPGKAKTIEFLKRSTEYLHGVVAGLSDADLEKAVTVFGNP